MIKLGNIFALAALITIVSDAEIKPHYKDKFQNVLLIINFNHPYYKNIEFIKKLYAPYFKKIVFYGEKPHDEVRSFYTNEGRLICQVLHDALERNPGYEGYLFLEDDCILNMWNCFALNLEKIWILAMHTPDWIHGDYKVAEEAAWANLSTGACHADWAWVSPTGLVAVKKAFSQLLPKDLEHIANNIGKDYAIGNSADMFYFPEKYRNDMLRLCQAFNNVFIEIAIPTMLACLDHKSKCETVSIVWGITDDQLKAQWPTHYNCVHPVKFSSDANRELVTTVFTQMIQ